MKFFIVVAITLLALANAQKGEKGKGEKGGKAGKGGSSEEMGDGENKAMCAEPEMLGAICVAGTKLGTKLNAAIAKCSGEEEMAKGRAGRPIKGLFKKLFKRKKGRGNKKGKGFKGGKGGKGGKCTSFDELMEKIDAETSNHRCVMKKMGWMDTDGNMVQDVHNADMLTLNKALTGKIDEAEIEECSKNVFEMMSKKHENNKCASSFDEDQVVTLEKIRMQMAKGKCAQKIFTALAYLTVSIYSS